MKQTRHPVRNLATRIHSFFSRATGGRFGRTVRGAPVLVLETRGRKTGKARTVPLLYIEDAGDWVVMASSGGDPLHPAWFKNLESDRRATVITEAGRRGVEAFVTVGGERERLFAGMTAMCGDFETYSKRTTRELPLVRLRPQD